MSQASTNKVLWIDAAGTALEREYPPGALLECVPADSAGNKRRTIHVAGKHLAVIGVFVPEPAFAEAGQTGAETVTRAECKAAR